MEVERATILPRAIATFVWFAMLTVGTNSFGSFSTWTGYNVVAPIVTLLGVGGMVATWTTPVRWHHRLDLAAMIAAVGTTLLTNAPRFAGTSYFNTDAAAFNQRATELLVAGVDPYRAVFRPAHLALDHAADFWTYTVNGGHVDRVSYPAGSFLLQVPLQLLGLRHLGTDWLDLFAWIAAGIILYVVAPGYAKWIAPLLMLATSLTYMFAHGGTDALFVPFMMLAAWRWDDFVNRDAPRWTHWVGPAALGVACSIKQTPWFAVPFFLVGVAIEARHHDVAIARTLARYAAWIVGAFAAINLPFVLWSPGAWWRGTMLPLTQPLVPDGQGLVSIATHGLVRQLRPGWLQVAGALALVALLGAFVAWYPVMKRTWLFAVPLIFFLPSRSLSSYLVDFVPAAFVLVLTTQRVPARWTPRTHRRLRDVLVALPATLAVVATVLAFTSPTLSNRVDHYGSTRDNAYLKPITLTITNHSDHPVTPHVMVVVGANHPVGFWTTLTGAPWRIPAFTTSTTVLRPPRFLEAPTYLESWLVEAFTSSPASLATSPAMTWPRGKKK